MTCAFMNKYKIFTIIWQPQQIPKWGNVKPNKEQPISVPCGILIRNKGDYDCSHKLYKSSNIYLALCKVTTAENVKLYIDSNPQCFLLYYSIGNNIWNKAYEIVINFLNSLLRMYCSQLNEFRDVQIAN